MRTTAFYILIVLLQYIPGQLCGQSNYEVIEQLLQVPRQYTVQKTSQKVNVDGQANEAAWQKALWIDDFVDIKGEEGSKPLQKTACKMLWDNEYLYVYARFNERDIWATVTEHDASVYHDNAFEIFFDPDGDGHNYTEFQINAHETVFDFLFPKPYRNGGSGIKSWEILGLKKAVYVAGTLNNPSDKDDFWSIELAIPIKSLTNKSASSGDIWRANLSRVQWDIEVKDGIYQKKRNSEGRFNASYWVWSPQGLVNLHYPERWGYIRFADEAEGRPASSFLDPEAEELKLEVWKYYYLQQDYKVKYGRYALNSGELEKAFPKVKFPAIKGLFLKAGPDQFEVGVWRESPGLNYSVNHEGMQNHRMPK